MLEAMNNLTNNTNASSAGDGGFGNHVTMRHATAAYISLLSAFGIVGKGRSLF